MTDRRQMCENAASRLQREAYEIQIKGRSKPLKQFEPCQKGLVYTAEIGRGNDRPQMLVTMEAALTFCDCHPSITETDLIEYETPKKIMFCKDCAMLGFPIPENNDTCGNCGSHKVNIFIQSS